MKRPLGLNLELPRKGSRMTSVYDPEVGSFVLAEQLRCGKLVVHDRLDAMNIRLRARQPPSSYAWHPQQPQASSFPRDISRTYVL